MNSQTTLSTTTNTDLSKERAMGVILHRLSQRIVWAGLGVLGGALGVTLAIGLAIIIQLLLFPTSAFSPNATLLTIIATVIGVGASWLLNLVARRILPGLFCDFAEQGLQVIFICSILTSLLQSLLFTHGF